MKAPTLSHGFRWEKRAVSRRFDEAFLAARTPSAGVTGRVGGHSAGGTGRVGATRFALICTPSEHARGEPPARRRKRRSSERQFRSFEGALDALRGCGLTRAVGAKWLVAVALGSWTLLANAASTEPNLLGNPGFEQGEVGKIPRTWAASGGEPPKMDRQWVTQAHAGEHAILIVDDAAGTRSERKGSSGIWQTVPAEPGRWYFASCWARCLSRSQARNVAWLQLRFLPSNARHNVHLNSSRPGGDWRRFVVAGQAPPGTTQVRVYVKTLHTSTCRYLVDDFVLRVVGSGGGHDQRLALLVSGSTGIEPVRRLNLHTPLVTVGRPAAHICAPPSKEWQEAARLLASEVERLTTARLPITKPTREALASRETTVAIGNINNNFVVERMWLNRYQRVDALHPGPGAYVLQTIPEPYDCPKGKNVLLIGASDAAGAVKGVRAIIGRLKPGKDLAIDEWLLEVSNAKPLSADRRGKLLSGKFSKYWLSDFWKEARKYQRTGDLAYAQRARQILLACAKRYREYAADPNLLKYWPSPTGGGQFRVYWPEETSSEWIGSMWDFIEECPVFTDQDRYVCTNALLSTTHDLTKHVYYWANLATPETTAPVAFNHTTYPLLGVYFLARYFERYYGDVDGRMRDYLDRCRNCFRAQMKSWKPTEDAAGYVSTVPRHTLTYSLAEGDYRYLASGAFSTFCQYTVGFCDNTGDAASFGDSGYGRGRYTRNLEWPVWYDKDAKMLWWLQSLTGGRWQNPFHPDLEPEPWTELPGVKVFPLTRALYDYTREHGSYGMARDGLNVPFEKCFDKISFRENLDKGAQFLLLDGFARGLHLHYDGNAIIKFYADGEDWLIDGDYLVRNTTDHNMLSLSKDGRCPEYEPPCASLDHWGDLPSVGITQTTVHDYLDADWTRSIFWLKGAFVCVIDRVRACEPGHFKCECIWKMLDRGETGGDGVRTFSLTRTPGGKPGKVALTVVEGPAPGVAAAVKFTSRDSRLDFPVDLRKGTYRVNAVGYGLNGGADSFWLSIDGGESIACHLPLKEFGRSYDSGVNPKAGAIPKVEVETDGLHVVTVTLREAPNVMLDRVEFLSLDGKLVTAIEAETAPELPPALVKPTPTKTFWIKGDGFSRLVFSTRFNHRRLPIRYTHQKLGARLETGQDISNQTIFYNTGSTTNQGFDIRRVATDTALLLNGGIPLGIFSGNAREMAVPDELRTDAALAFWGRERLVFCDATQVGSILSTDIPVDVEIDLQDGRASIRADGAVAATVGSATTTMAGRGELKLPESVATSLRKAWLPALERIARSAQVGKAGDTEERAERGLTPVWSVGAARHDDRPQPVLEVIPADLDGDGRDEILAIRGRHLTCIDAAGRVRWEFDGKDELYAACAWDIDGDGAAEVFCGGKSTRLYVLDTDGKLLRDHPIETYYRVSRTTIHEPRLDDVLVRDFDGDGDWEAVLGTVDGFTQLIDHHFKQVWIDGETNHGTTEFQAIDVDGDGTEEVVVGNRYGKLRVYRIKTGKLAVALNSELGDVQIAAADLDGDGAVELLNGSSTGAFRCGKCQRSRRAEVVWEFPNYGYAVRDIKVADLAEASGLEVAVASDTEFVYLVGNTGATLAQRDLGSAPLSLAIVETAGPRLLAAGCRDGGVHLLDGALDVRGCWRAGSQINSVATVRRPGGSLVVAGCADGRVVALTPTE